MTSPELIGQLVGVAGFGRAVHGFFVWIAPVATLCIPILLWINSRTVARGNERIVEVRRRLLEMNAELLVHNRRTHLMHLLLHVDDPELLAELRDEIADYPPADRSMLRAHLAQNPAAAKLPPQTCPEPTEGRAPSWDRGVNGDAAPR